MSSTRSSGGASTTPTVMSSMYTDLEPEGTARALNMLEQQQSMYGDGSALDLAKTCARVWRQPSNDPSFSGETYGNELMRCSSPRCTPTTSRSGRASTTCPRMQGPRCWRS